MAHWDNAAVTREGIVLLNEMMAGHELILTRACGGTGTVEVSDMVEQTGLQEEKQTLKLTDEKDGPDGKTVTVQISSIGNETEYLLQQIGVYAKLDTDGAEKLLFIMQDEGVLIPAESDKSFLLEIFCALRIGENGKLTVIVDPTGIVTLDRLSQTESKFDRLLGEIDPLSGTGEPDSTTPGQVGQKYEDTTSGDIYTCTAITPGESGASPHYLWVPGRLGTLAEIRTAYSNIDRRLVGINLLHNAYWAAKEYIINQRGQLEYTGGYGIDRWRIDNQGGSAKLSILDNCIRFQKLTTQSAMAIHQSLEFPQFLRGKVITASVLRRGTGNTSMLIYTDKGNLGAPSFKPSEKWVLDSYTFTVPTDINRVSLFLYPSTGNNAYYTDYMASQLELGPVSTLAHKEGDTWVLNDPPPNLALERLKCQRYQVFGQLESTYLTGTSNTKIAFLPTPTALRATPTIVGTPEVWTVDDNIKLSNVTVSVHSVVKNGVLLSLVGDTRACYVSMKSGCGFDSNL